MLSTDRKDTGPERFSPISEVLPEGSPTDSVLTAAATEAEGRIGLLGSKPSSKDNYISQVRILAIAA